MEVFDYELQFIKDIFAEDTQREVLKRTFAICLSRANPNITLGDIQKLSDTLDDLLLEKDEGIRMKNKNMTL